MRWMSWWLCAICVLFGGVSLAAAEPPKHEDKGATSQPAAKALDGGADTATSQPAKAKSSWGASLVIAVPKASAWFALMEHAKKRGLWSKRLQGELNQAKAKMQKLMGEFLKEKPAQTIPGLLQQFGFRLNAQVGMSVWLRGKSAVGPARELLVLSMSAEGSRFSEMFRKMPRRQVRWLPEQGTEQLMMETHHQREWLTGFRFGNRFHFFVRDKEPMFQGRPPSATELKAWEEAEATFRTEAYDFLREHKGFLAGALAHATPLSALKPDPSQLLWGYVDFRYLKGARNIEEMQRFVKGVAFSVKANGDDVKASIAVVGQPILGPFLKLTMPTEKPISVDTSVPEGMLYLQSQHLNIREIGNFPGHLGRLGLIPQKALFSMYLGYGMVDSMAMQMGIRLKQIWGPLNGQLLIGMLDRPWIRASLQSRAPIEAATSPFLMLGLKKGHTGQAWLGRLLEAWPKVSKLSKRIGRRFSVSSKKQGDTLIATVALRGRTIAVIAGHGRWLVASASPRTIQEFVQMWDGKSKTLAQGQSTLSSVLAKRMQHFSVLDLGAVLSMLPRRAWPREFRYLPMGAKALILKGLLSLESPLFGMEAKGNDIFLAASSRMLPINEGTQEKVQRLLQRMKPPAFPSWRGRLPVPPTPVVPPQPPVVERPKDNDANSPPTPPSRVARKKVVGLSLVGAPSLGERDAPITIVEFSDFQCPFCARAAKTMGVLMSEFPGKVRLVFKHRPLSFHRQAKLAAIASMAAHRQGKFWPYHDKLFANRRNLGRDALIGYARDLGMDLEEFERDLNDASLKKYVEADDAMAVRLGARGTPTFLINGYRIVGAQPLSRFRSIVRGLLVGKAPVEARPYRPRRRVAKKRQVIVVGKAPVWGPADAKITIAIFSDFQCPFCSRATRTLEQIKKAYPGQVRFVFKHMPLPFHRQAKPAAIAAMAAHQQGKFWEYHDKLFANYRNLSEETFLKLAEELGLDLDRFKQESAEGMLKAHVEADIRQAKSVGVSGTPSFFINGYPLVGAQPFYRFKQVIDAEVAGKPLDVNAPLRYAPPKAPRPYAPPAPAKPIKLVVGQSPVWGPADAKVTIAIFSDFQCPFCSRVVRTLEQIKKAYPGQVRFVFKHMPLPFHRQAKPAAIAAMAAHQQGKFWEYHDKLFANYRNLGEETFLKLAEELGLDLQAFKASLNDPKIQAQVEADMRYAQQVGVRGTPSFFINGKKVVGALPFYNFKQKIDAELKK